MRAAWYLLTVSVVLLAGVVDGTRSRRQVPSTTILPESDDTDHSCDNPTFPCANGGSCIGLNDDDGDFYCECALGWTGENCTELSDPPEIDLCDGVCENGGTCYLSEAGTPTCNCPADWQGTSCSVPTNDGSRSSTTPPNNDNTVSGVQVGAIVGLAVGVFLLFVVIFGIAYIVARASKLRRVPHRHDPPISAASPSVIYDPNVHDHFDGSVHAGDLKYSKNLYDNNGCLTGIPRHYTSPSIQQQSRGFTEPGTRPYDYGYQPGPSRTPTKKTSTSESVDHEYTYIDPAASDVPTRLPPALPESRPPPPYTRALSHTPALYSKAPSRAPSRVSEHTYQSPAEYYDAQTPRNTAYEGQRLPSRNSQASQYYSRK